MERVKLLPLMILFVCLACEKDTEDTLSFQSDSSLEKFKLELSEKYSLELDSATSFYNNSIQYTEKEGKQYISLFNELNGKLYIYDYDDGMILNSIKFQTKGPNGVGRFYLMGHYFHNADSIFLYNFPFKRLYLANSKGKVYDNYNMAPDHLPLLFSYPWVSTSYPMVLEENRLHFWANAVDIPKDHTKIDVKYQLDLSTKKIETHIPRPALYNKANWGVGGNYIVYGDFNEVDSLFVYGFPVDHQIRVWSMAGEQKAYMAKSKFFSEILPFSSKRRNGPEYYENDKMRDHNATTPSYGSLKYDKYNDVYYRVASHPLSLEKWRDPSASHLKRVSIIIMDSNFKKIGETKINEAVYYTSLLVTREGILLPDLEEYKKNENKLTFNLYKLAKK